MELINCKFCNKKFNKKYHNQKFCSNKCRENLYKKEYLIKRKLDKCVICGFPYFTEKHHIIKRLEFGSDSEKNLVYLCKNHHYMADSIQFEKIIKKLIYNKTGKKGEKLPKNEIKLIKKTINEDLRTLIED